MIHVLMMLKERLCRSIPRGYDGIKHIISSYSLVDIFVKHTNPNCKECQLYDMCKDKIKEVRK